MKSQMLIKPLGLSTSFICAMEETASSWATQSNNHDIQSREVILHAIATMGKSCMKTTTQEYLRLNPIRCIWPCFFESSCCQWIKFWVRKKSVQFKCFYHPSWDESVSERPGRVSCAHHAAGPNGCKPQWCCMYKNQCCTPYIQVNPVNSYIKLHPTSWLSPFACVTESVSINILRRLVRIQVKRPLSTGACLEVL